MNKPIQVSLDSIEPLNKKSFDLNLESLRGVAALAVIWGHILFADSRIDPGWFPTGIWSYTAPAHVSVLVFFLLSGYVIRLTCPEPLTQATIPSYLKKRVIRIYPIYLICLLLAFAVAFIFAGKSYSIGTVISHLTMTEGLFSPVIRVIAPAWSITYEIVFYLLFIPISFFRLNPVRIALLSAGIGLLNAYLYPRYGSPLLSSFGFGFCFWLTGVILVDTFRHRTRETSYAAMASMIFLFLSVEKLDGVITLFNRAELAILGRDLSQLPMNQPGAVLLRDFTYLPICILIILVFSSHQFRYMTAVRAVLLLLPAITFYSYYKHAADQSLSLVVLPLLFYSLSIIFFLFYSQLEAISKTLVESIFVTGGISYALYIVHFPVLYAFGKTSTFSGSALTFTARVAAFLLITIGSAYVLDKRLQPWLKKKLL